MHPVSQNHVLANYIGSYLLQEIKLLRSVSFDQNIVQFCGACLQPKDTMMILEYMAVSLVVMIKCASSTCLHG